MGYKKSELARQLDISPAMITYYEQGKRQPSLKIVTQIAEIIKVPLEYFFSEKEYTCQTASRGMGNISKEEKEEVADFQLIVDNFLNVAGSNEVDLAYTGPKEYLGQVITDQAIGSIKILLDLPDILDYESLSEALWRHWKIPIFYIPFKSQQLSGITIKRDNIFVIFINKGHTVERNFFSLAHELGHVLMHLKDDDCIISRLSSRHPLEKQASDFARRFIVPSIPLQEKLQNDLPVINREKIQVLAKSFNVSYVCMVYNLEKMKLISYTDPVSKPEELVNLHYEEIWKYQDFPVIYQMCVFHAWYKGDISISKAALYLFSDLQSTSVYFNKIKNDIFN
jgi:Zn-dependent peptidase ImmA (M78 family)/DNA-binding XRE family transcriptional regulator